MPDFRNRWLAYAQRIHALAVTGLTYGLGPFDRERYQELEDLALDMLSDLGDGPPFDLKPLFPIEQGYQTPKVDVRGVVFDEDRILLVREQDNQRWALPGGWADVGLTPAENVVKEVEEESGLKVEAKALIAVLDKKCHPHRPEEPHYAYKMFFYCEAFGGHLRTSYETTEVGFFSRHSLPMLSENRNTPGQIEMCFDYHERPTLGTRFD
ncbi:MAG: NUDIX domain-containing protein [Bacteroidetes bacterium]|nr:MAG: NUDIX domain-containing protein [Bacteroidota bacterium]